MTTYCENWTLFSWRWRSHFSLSSIKKNLNLRFFMQLEFFDRTESSLYFSLIKYCCTWHLNEIVYPSKLQHQIVKWNSKHDGKNFRCIRTMQTLIPFNAHIYKEGIAQEKRGWPDAEGTEPIALCHPYTYLCASTFFCISFFFFSHKNAENRWILMIITEARNIV